MTEGPFDAAGYVDTLMTGEPRSDESKRGEPAVRRGRMPSLVVRPIKEVIADVEGRGKRRFLVEAIIPERSYGVLAAPPKAQKSLDVADLAVSVASGTPWLGTFPVGVTGPVLVVYNEGDEEELMRRLHAIADARELECLDLPLHISVTPPQLLDPGSMSELAEALDRIRPVLTILDPLYVSAGGADHRSLYAMGEALANLQRVGQEAETALFTAHHFNRNGGARGIERMSGAGPAEWGRFLITADVESRRRTPEGGTDMLRRFEVTGSSIPEAAFHVRRVIQALDPVDLSSPLSIITDVKLEDGEQVGGHLSPAQRRIVDILDGPDRPLLVREIGDRLAHDGLGPALKKKTIQNALGELVDADLVDGADDGPGLPKRWWRTA